MAFPKTSHPNFQMKTEKVLADEHSKRYVLK